jgi:alpha-amylase
MIYSGQEMPNQKRLKFFEKDTIEWTGEYHLHDFYKKLNKLRSDHPAIRMPGCEPQLISTNANNTVLTFIRQYEEQMLLVLLNFSGEERAVELPANLFENVFYDVFTEIRTGIAAPIILGPWNWLVLSNSL